MFFWVWVVCKVLRRAFKSGLILGLEKFVSNIGTQQMDHGLLLALLKEKLLKPNWVYMIGFSQCTNAFCLQEAEPYRDFAATLTPLALAILRNDVKAEKILRQAGANCEGSLFFVDSDPSHYERRNDKIPMTEEQLRAVSRASSPDEVQELVDAIADEIIRNAAL